MFEMIQGADASVLLWIQEHLRFAFLNGPMILAGWLGDNGLCWIMLGLVLTLIPKTRKYGVLALTSLLGCFLFNNLLLKNLVARPRPYTQIPELVMLMKVPPDHSFPSGHACASLRHSRSIDVEHGQEMESGADPRIGGGSLDRIQPPLCGCPLPHRCLGWCVGRARWQLDHLPYL